jgi:hypothetical protein
VAKTATTSTGSTCFSGGTETSVLTAGAAGAVGGGRSAGTVRLSSQGRAEGAGPGPTGPVLWMPADAMPGQPAAAIITAVTAPSAGRGNRRARRLQRGSRCAGVSPEGRLLPSSTRFTILVTTRREYPVNRLRIPYYSIALDVLARADGSIIFFCPGHGRVSQGIR